MIKAHLTLTVDYLVKQYSQGTDYGNMTFENQHIDIKTRANSSTCWHNCYIVFDTMFRGEEIQWFRYEATPTLFLIGPQRHQNSLQGAVTVE